MDFFESTKVVFERIEQLEPVNVSKIIGHLLLRDQPELEMIRLAFCPDHALQILIHKVKLELHLSPNKPQPLPWPDPIPQMLDFRPTVQVCNSFRQGYCKYGGSCRFLHVFQMQNGDCMVLNPPATSSCGSLKQLEMELIELLRSTRGIPVSLSSLPILYFDRFGKVLQETENHGHGRLSSRMIKLLARMTPNTIRLTNRPHRRQSIILDEDMDRYARFRVENGRQLQVYLTFPPESIFSEQDVHNYFNNFGAVQDVRIPSQVHRMFGFVSFAYPETAALVLTITNPHNICGSQVLVKPYQFKPMLLHRDHDEEVHDQEDAESPTPGLEDDNDSLGKHQTEGHG